MENCNYRHKKFDQRKRSRDEEDQVTSVDTVKRLKMEHNYEAHSESFSRNSSHSDTSTAATTASASAAFSMFRENLTTTSTPVLVKNEPLLSPSVAYASSQSETNSSITPHRPMPAFQASTGSYDLIAHVNPLSAITLPTKKRKPAIPPSTAAILPKISDAVLNSICQYHGNMVRRFPKKERSPRDQERRNKNTIACRLSRRVKKLEHIAIEEQYREFSQQHMNIVEESMRAAAYLNELMKLSAVGKENTRERVNNYQLPYFPQQDSLKFSPTPASGYTHSEVKKPFSIAYLVGSEAN